MSVAALVGESVTTRVAGAQEAPDPPAPYTRYAFPIECAQVQARRERLFWRDQRPDTVYHPPLGDVPLPFAVASAGACVNRYQLASVPQRDLIGYGAALLDAQKWTTAEQAYQRLLTALEGASVYERARALQLMVEKYAETTGQLPVALSYLRQLEALGDVAAPERMLGQLAIVQRAQFADSLSLLDSAVTGALRASRALTGDSAKRYALVSANAYLALADLHARRHHADSAIAAVQMARTTLGPLRPIVMMVLQGAEAPYQLLGKPAPKLQASVWFGGEGAATQRPVAGKPTLVVFANHNCGNRCYPGYSVLRRLYAKYASAGLQIVIASRTMGYYKDDLVQPDSEATLVHKYFVDDLKLPPLTLAVWKTPFERRTRDGRMMAQSQPNEEAFHPNLSTPLPVYLVDRQGIIQAVSSLIPKNEAFLDHQLQALR
jgi:hypothetical protein